MVCHLLFLTSSLYYSEDSDDECSCFFFNLFSDVKTGVRVSFGDDIFAFVYLQLEHLP